MTNYYNNFGIGAVAIASVLKFSHQLPVAKVFLIFPFLSNIRLLHYLGRSSTNIESFDSLIIDKINLFSNFNKRYLSSVQLTSNAIQYLTEMEYVEIKDGKIKAIKSFEYETSMGSRAKKIFNAAKNVSIILDTNAEELYLNLRVEI